MNSRNHQFFRFQRIPSLLLVALVRFYQLVISPMKNALLGPGGCCRFYPTCSQYSIESLKVHGFWLGGYYSLRRILRCHPFHAGGWDPVKPQKQVCATQARKPESLADLLP